jgi:hypothetical protein
VTSHITKRRSSRKEERLPGWKMYAENMLQCPCSMAVQWLFNGCSMAVQWLFNGCSMAVQWLFNGCSMAVQW